jgi:hypothetical protein
MRIRLSPKVRILLSLFVLFSCFLTISQSALRTKVVQARERAEPQEAAAPPQASATPLAQPANQKSRSTWRRIFDYLKCEPAKREMEQRLFSTGPLLPGSYNMSDFSFPALVKGKWPVVIVYELESESKAVMRIEVKDVTPPFVQEFAATGRGQRLEMNFTLPERFGDKPQAARIGFRATTNADPLGKKLAYFRIVDLGMGDEAVGSVPIDVSYQPNRINTSRKEPLNYSYDSRKPYDDVRADFWRVKIVKGVRRPALVSSAELGALRAAEPRSNQWYGRRNRGKGPEFSLGQHEFHLNARVRGAWILAWSADDPILVE